MGGVFIHLCFQVYEGQVRSVSLEGISSLQEVDLRLNTWRSRMETMEDVSLQVHLSRTFNRRTHTWSVDGGVDGWRDLQ